MVPMFLCGATFKNEKYYLRKCSNLHTLNNLPNNYILNETKSTI